MYKGDYSRKKTLVEYGFRLPSALDNRPLKFDEFENLINQVVFVSATPGKYEITKTKKENVIEQIIRPTYLIDPIIEIKKKIGQIDNFLKQIEKQIEKKERTIALTLTVKLAKELANYLKLKRIKSVNLW